MIPKPKRHVNKDLLAYIRSKPCDVCGKKPTKDYPNQACHIGTRGAFHDDAEDNLYTGCLEHHQMQGKEGWVRMFEKFPKFKELIESKGWGINEYGKMRRK